MTLLPKCLRKRGILGKNREDIQAEIQLNLRDLSPGNTARLTGFSSRISPEKRSLLRAYGLVPGYQIRVLQHSPVSVIQVDHTEIALEPDLAAELFIIIG